MKEFYMLLGDCLGVLVCPGRLSWMWKDEFYEKNIPELRLEAVDLGLESSNTGFLLLKSR
jgi:hypothetical protein